MTHSQWLSILISNRKRAPEEVPKLAKTSEKIYGSILWTILEKRKKNFFDHIYTIPWPTFQKAHGQVPLLGTTKLTSRVLRIISTHHEIILWVSRIISLIRRVEKLLLECSKMFCLVRATPWMWNSWISSVLQGEIWKFTSILPQILQKVPQIEEGWNFFLFSKDLLFGYPKLFTISF